MLDIYMYHICRFFDTYMYHICTFLIHICITNEPAFLREAFPLTTFCKGIQNAQAFLKEAFTRHRSLEKSVSASLKKSGEKSFCYGVATMSRLLRIIGLFCRISSLSLGSFAKETYNFTEPTNRSYPIPKSRKKSCQKP